MSTTHGRLDLAEVRRLYGCFPEQHLVSISRDQQARLPRARWLGTAYTGIDLDHCDTVHALVDAMPRVRALDQQACREHVADMFSAQAMATGYEQIYARMLATGRLDPPRQLARTLTAPL